MEKKLVFIEVEKGDNKKYEHDKELDIVVLDRFLHNTHMFPYNYGYIPNTYSPDGDPLDIIVLCDPLDSGKYVWVKVVGVVKTVDENGEDDKIISVPVDKSCPRSKYINNIDDVNPEDMRDIIYFLNHYKDGEKGKKVTVGETLGKEEALKVIIECENAYKRKMEAENKD